ncbi:GNAT family N-acetyltransferase [Candidatus Woesearchaeota archaeon]|nr:GNAT family N-acetyltransferase [Candidatus Woesearchaeota archaeon]
MVSGNSIITIRDVEIKELSNIYDLSGFDCEDDDLNEFLKKDAFEYRKELIAKTFLVIYKEQVIGFFSVMNDAVKLRTEESSFLNVQHLHEYPSLKIGRLAVDKRFKKQGIGRICIDFIVGLGMVINETSACRFITVDSYPLSVGFYEKQGFVQNQMYSEKRNFVSMRLDLLMV